jgi:undecaprenyl diphosphate synthase
MENDALPRHIGFIMDGNGRWAKRRGLPRAHGHRAGVKAFNRVCDDAAALGIPFLTFYAFSTENWARPQQEVDGIMDLFRRQLDEMERRADENERKGLRIRYIGAFDADSPVPPDIARRLREMETRSASKTRTVVNVAVNYGGQDEIFRAAQRLATDTARGDRRPETLTPADLEACLDTAGQPPLDLLVRPGGERRLSNFMLWQCAYAELWFSDVLWPDFSVRELRQALADYAKRARRFGDV